MNELNDIPKTIEFISIDKYPDMFIRANSLVAQPAIEQNIEYFANKKDNDYYIYALKPDYVGEPLLKENSHQHCKDHAGKTYSKEQINNWIGEKDSGFIDGANTWFATFPNLGYNLNEVLFNCRHYLKKVRTFSFETEDFSDLIDDEMIVEGPVMLANKEIIRKNVKGGLGYYIFDNKTVEYLQKQYGKNGMTTYAHADIDISKKVYIRDSWIKDNNGNKEWWMNYRILDKSLWQDIKNKVIKGFSVELGW